MSAESQPITHARFAAALESLSLGSLHAKAAELRNNIEHLEISNSELSLFYAETSDPDFSEAIADNEQTIRRKREQIAMLKIEVERRGMPWVEDEQKMEKKDSKNGNQNRSIDNDHSGQGVYL
ncbi:hypothetical protein EJ05DRAFT_187012 [Pseudovirgaria hyperparasitica]|uniref:Uncharacterized protein n=1 Tax=Pseudovirgaria hyperparasitica TaxID=470096 RepID=A0A6A6WIB5_9PEZI|nr:uncharacterized protein EJ05DRAFT_187012 [Pseudovirgaria hyperparasitica]KAF2761855.1 hypothetical protein EJ05DRAFT_187012 [Pseudovirgaria hyperparasitica]